MQHWGEAAEGEVVLFLLLASKNDSSRENSLATVRKKQHIEIIPGCFGQKVMII